MCAITQSPVSACYLHEQSFLTDKEALLSHTDKDAQTFLSPSTSRITPGPDSPFSHAVETPSLESRLVHDHKEDNGDKREIYDGLFNARPAALYHDLCVTVRSRVVTPWRFGRLRNRGTRQKKSQKQRPITSCNLRRSVRHDSA